MKDLSTYSALVDSFSKLPGIGTKTAERLAYAVLEMNEEDAKEFSQAILDAKTNVHKCSVCGLYAEGERCDICQDASRDHSVCIVLSYPKDVVAFERLEGFHGVYHVLNGLISMSKGVGPDDLNIDDLLKRCEECDEVILATNTTMDGETTAMYLGKLIRDHCPETLVTRIAHGLPAGGLLDYADEMTLSHALSGRKKIG